MGNVNKIEILLSKFEGELEGIGWDFDGNGRKDAEKLKGYYLKSIIELLKDITEDIEACKVPFVEASSFIPDDSSVAADQAFNHGLRASQSIIADIMPKK